MIVDVNSVEKVHLKAMQPFTAICHISNTVACQRKSQHDFRAYAGGIWDEWPTFRPDAEPLRDPSSEQDMSLELVDNEVDNFDFSLEDDRVYGDLTYAASANPQPQSSRLIFTSEKWFEKEQLVWYVEEFDPKSLARATWGEGMPVFESLHLK